MPQTAIVQIARPDIDNLRSEIDRIDDELLLLMEERLCRAADIAASKRNADASQLKLRPARERQVVERLARNSDLISLEGIERVWRELMAASLQSQQVTRLIIHAPQRPIQATDSARRAFGCAAPAMAADTAEEALDLARSGDAIAIIELSPLGNWWTALADEPELAIFEGLRDSHGRLIALAVGRLAADHHAGSTSYSILSETELRVRTEAGEAIRALALSGSLRLCISTGARAGTVVEKLR